MTTISAWLVGAAMLVFTTSCSHAIPVQVNDALTTAQVRTALVNDPTLGVRSINVVVTAGVAHLAGRVASDEEARRLVALVAGVAGVRTVQSEVQVGLGAPKTEADRLSPPSVHRSESIEAARDPRLFAVGAAISHIAPRSGRLSEHTVVGPLFRLGSGSGWAPAIGFSWFSAGLHADAAGAERLGRLNVRPVMGGLEHTWSGEHLSASFGLVGGIGFVGLRVERPDPGGQVPLHADSTLVWRPGFSVWYDVSQRFALNAFSGYVVARPSVTYLVGDQIETRRQRADTVLFSAGLAYKVF